MDLTSIIQDLSTVQLQNAYFMERHGEEILDFLKRDPLTADESLEQEILIELNDRVTRLDQIINYLQKKHLHFGTLSRDRDGHILFDGYQFPCMKEFEVFIPDELSGKYIWTRTYVSMSAKNETPYLIGLGKQLQIDGIKARYRTKE